MRRFDFSARVLGQPFIEQVFEGDKVAQALVRILIVCDGDVADALFREYEFQVIIHHDMLASEAGEVLGYNAADLSRVHVGHHALKGGTLEACA